MSAPAKREVNDERVLEIRRKLALRDARCVVCSCERFEFDRLVDGYDHCVCNHTQWGHVDPSSKEAFDLNEKRRAESEAALAKEVQ